MIARRVEGNVRVTTFTGVVTSAEVFRNFAALRNQPDFDPRMDSLLDQRGVDAFDFAIDDMTQLGQEYVGLVGPHGRRRMAVVASRKIAIGYARAFEMFAGDRVEMRMFEDIEEARRWLGLPPEAPEIEPC